MACLKELCSKNEYTKSESNSQHRRSVFVRFRYCVQRTNIQNLKAIHNMCVKFKSDRTLCSKNEYTKSESNSQRTSRPPPPSSNCVQRTNIQNLKAIHNPGHGVGVEPRDCVQRTNIQNLKAIHNQGRALPLLRPIVFKERIYKI